MENLIVNDVITTSEILMESVNNNSKDLNPPGFANFNSADTKSNGSELQLVHPPKTLDQNLKECLEAYEEILRVKLNPKNQQEFMKRSLKIYDDVYLDVVTRSDVWPDSQCSNTKPSINLNNNTNGKSTSSRKGLNSAPQSTKLNDLGNNNANNGKDDIEIKKLTPRPPASPKKNREKKEKIDKEMKDIASDEDEYEDKKHKKRGPPKKEFNRSKRIKSDTAKKRILYDDVEDITCSPDSILCTIDLKDIINLKTFNNNLSSAEKDSLLKYLPHVDKLSKENVYNVFKNNVQFQSSIELYQDMLETGSFQDGKPIEKKDLMDPFKREHYERFWGEKNQQQLNEEILEKQYLGIPLDQKEFSFIEYEKEQLSLGVLAEAIYPKLDDEPEKVEPAKPLSQRRKKSAGDVASPVTCPKSKEKSVDSDPDFDEEIDLDKDGDEGWGPTVFIEDDDDDLLHDDKDSSSDGEKKITKKRGPKKNKGLNKCDKSSTFRNGAIEILRKNGKPMGAIDIVQKGLSTGIFTNLSGKTPQNTLAALLYVDIKKNGDKSEFTKVGPGKFGLKEF